MSIEYGIALLGALAAIITALIADRRAAKQSVVSGFSVLIDNLQEENDRMAARLAKAERKLELHECDRARLAEAEREINSLRAEVDSLSAGVQVLIEQIVALGHQPAWRPPKQETGAPGAAKARRAAA